MIALTYTAAKTNAVAVLAETVIGDRSVALIRTTVSPKRYAVVTSGGGTQTGIRSEASGRFAFAQWCRSLDAAR